MKSLCSICYNVKKCKYCISYGKNIGSKIYQQNFLCDTCNKKGNLCEFCNKYGMQRGKYYYKTYLEFVKKSYA